MGITRKIENEPHVYGLDVRTYGEKTAFLELHVLEPMFAPEITVVWKAKAREGDDEALRSGGDVLRQFRKGVLEPGRPLLISFPCDLDEARSRFETVGATIEFPHGRLVTGAAIFDLDGLVTGQELAGVVEGDIVEWEFEREPEPTWAERSVVGALERVSGAQQRLVYEAEYASALASLPWWKRLFGKTPSRRPFVEYVGKA